MRHFTLRPNAGRLATGALAAGAVAVIVAFPTAAFAGPLSGVARSTTTTASSGAGTAGSSSTSAPASNPFCTPSTVAQAQQTLEAALSGRVAQLNALLSAVNTTANHLTPSDAQTLQHDISSVELPGIQALQPEAEQASTCPALRSIARQMVFNFRVYVVMTPQTRLTIVADGETYIEGVFAGLEPKISAAIQNAQSQGKDVSGAQSAFQDFQNQVTSAQNATNGVSAQVLAQTPGGYPGNWTVFLNARTSVTNARTALHSALADARQIRSDLS